MQRSWLARHFGWIQRDLRSAFTALKQLDTWILIGLVLGFVVIAIYVMRLALRSDTMLRALHPAMALCRELGDNAVAFMFVGMIFFGLTVLATLGEFLGYVDAKRRHAHHATRSALRGAAGWGAAAIVLGLAVVVFLDSRCV